MPKDKKVQKSEQQEINEAMKATLKIAQAELAKRQRALQKAKKKAGEVASPQLLWTLEMGVGVNADAIDSLTKLLKDKTKGTKEVRKSWEKSLKTAQKNLKTRTAEYKKAKEKADLIARLEEAVKKQQELVNLWQEQVDKATMDEWEVMEYVPQTEAGAEYPTMEEIQAAVKEEMPNFFEKSAETSEPEFFEKPAEKASEVPQPQPEAEYPTLEEVQAHAAPQDLAAAEVHNEFSFEDVTPMPEERLEAAAPAMPEAAAEDEYPTLEEVQAHAAPQDLAAAEVHNEFSFEDVTPMPEERLEAAAPAMPEAAAEAEYPTMEEVRAHAAPQDLAAAEVHNEFSFEDVTPAPEERLEPAPHVEKSPEQLAAEKQAEEARKQKAAEEKQREKTHDVNRAMEDVVREQIEAMKHIANENGQFNGKEVGSLKDNVMAFAKDKKHDSHEFSVMRDALNDLNIKNLINDIALQNSMKRGDLSTVQKYQEKLQKAREATQSYIDKKEGELVSGKFGWGSGKTSLDRAQATMDQLDKMMVCLDSIVENRKYLEDVADYKYDMGKHGENINLKELEKKVADKRPRPAKKQAVKKSEIKKAEVKKDVQKGKKV